MACDGTVRWFNSERGFGLITPDGDELPDVFVHYSQLPPNPTTEDGKKYLRPGQRIRFEVVPSAKGLEAHDVRDIVEPQENSTTKGPL